MKIFRFADLLASGLVATAGVGKLFSSASRSDFRNATRRRQIRRPPQPFRRGPTCRARPRAPSMYRDGGTKTHAVPGLDEERGECPSLSPGPDGADAERGAAGPAPLEPAQAKTQPPILRCRPRW